VLDSACIILEYRDILQQAGDVVGHTRPVKQKSNYSQGSSSARVHVQGFLAARRNWADDGQGYPVGKK